MATPARVAAPRRLHKSPSAFRTISEVSGELDVPQHVLRFWETKFAQLRPLKRGGGRRYYRPEDVELLGRIRELLYRDGYTIKGVQRLFRNEGGKAPRGMESDRDDPSDVAPAIFPAIPPASSHPGDGRDQRAVLEAVLRDLLEIRNFLRARAQVDDD
ncbi:MAG TPA: MerR family transcriptional regulator [Alphaproteobacteria bacterium]|jgi:DNA-binding transcriptional MerR regulator|nr:MerR family transcriptional regulator [Alphaproteobacteria bacterium]